MKAEQYKERRYKKAKRFTEWILRKWWWICGMINLCYILIIIVNKANSEYLKLPFISCVYLFITLVLILSMALGFLAILYAFKIVDDYEDNN